MFIGHQKQWDYLRKSIESDRVAHAYLFYGPAKIGKKTVALEFAKLLTGSAQDGNFSPDLLLIEPETSDVGNTRRIIHIPQIRSLKSRLFLSAINPGYKVAILDDASCMTFDAQGALLKLLEEPKGKTVIILISEHLSQLLPTIVSRCQPIRFALLSSRCIDEYLQTKMSPGRAQEISRLSFGKPGLALDYVNNSQEEELQKTRIKEIMALCNAPLNIRFRYAEKLAKQRYEMNKALEIWLNCFRELLLEKIGIKKGVMFSKTDKHSLKSLKNIINLIEKIRFVVLTTNANPRLALEVLFLKI
jgi:DNA polymerase-3 subunit delta'